MIEDDESLADAVQDALADAGHTMLLARSGREGLSQAIAGGFDVVIMERKLAGGVDGIGLVQALRLDGFDVPVLLVSALCTVDDKTRGLRAGADDYLAKPFSEAELVARVEALGRRRQRPDCGAPIDYGDLRLDPVSRVASKGGRTVSLNAQEARFLEFLLRRPGQLVTSGQLLDAGWPSSFDPNSNVVEAHISRLRRKLAFLGDTDSVQTIRGAGYVLQNSGVIKTSLN